MPDLQYDKLRSIYNQVIRLEGTKLYDVGMEKLPGTNLVKEVRRRVKDKNVFLIREKEVISTRTISKTIRIKGVRIRKSQTVTMHLRKDFEEFGVTCQSIERQCELVCIESKFGSKIAFFFWSRSTYFSLKIHQDFSKAEFYCPLPH